MTNKNPNAHPLPDWVVKEGIYAATSHEPLKFFRRTGNNPQWREEWYYAHRTEEFAARMADAGFNHINLALFKGFGLEEEHEEIEDLRKRIPVFHKHGIKVRAYIQFGSLMYETFLKEVPDAADWCKRNSQGNMMTYRWGNQDWRWRPCHNRPEFRAYLKKCVDRAIEIGVDAIGFDNVKQGWAGDYHDLCYCETCRSLFRGYLKKNLAGREDLVGISTFDHVEPPTEHHPKTVICQAWLRFQDECLHANVQDLCEYAKNKKPDVLINVNGLPAHVTGTCADAATWEGHFYPGIEEDEILSGAHTYKHANDRGMQVYVFPTSQFGAGEAGSADDPKLRTLKLGIARSAAFGGHGIFVPAIFSKMRGPEFPLEKPAFADACRSYFSFFKKYRSAFYPLESLANVAVYLNWPSWNLCHERVQAVYQLVEQVLLRNHILFDIFYVRSLDDIRKYDLLVCPDIKCMSDEEIEAIKSFEDSGGRVAPLAETSLYDEYFRERLKPGFEETMSVSDVALEPGGWRQFQGTILSVLEGTELPIEVSGPDSLIVDAYKVKGTGKSIVSLLNFNSDQKARDVVVKFSRESFGDLQRVSMASPDRSSSEPIPLAIADESVAIPEVDIYTLLVIESC